MVDAIRSCAGGVVFFKEQVFLLMSDRGEWVMPKGVIRNHIPSNDVALWRVEDETGIHAHILGVAGNTRYDFYSESREKDVSNRIQWYAMEADDDTYRISFEQGFLNGGYYSIDKAVQMLSHEPDRNILTAAYSIYKSKSAL